MEMHRVGEAQRKGEPVRTGGVVVIVEGGMVGLMRKGLTLIPNTRLVA